MWLVTLSYTLQGQAQTYKVESGKTIAIEIPGATAAYSLDAFYADAEADNGVVRVAGKIHGTTHIVVVTAAGAQPLEIQVFDQPVKLPPGFLNPFLLATGSQNGFFESRYDSLAGLVQSQVDLSRTQAGTTIHMHLMGTRLLGEPSQGASRTQLSSAYYQILTPRRDITFLDQYLMESPLGINGSIVRGLHYSQDGWFFHGGYTSASSFEGEFLPSRAEGVLEGGYRYSLGDHSSLTGTFYYFDVAGSDSLGRGGSVGLITYAFSPNENFHVTVDGGYSRGPAGSARLEYHGKKDNLKGMIRFTPPTFASLGANSQRGYHDDLSWTHQLTSRLTSDVATYSSRLTLPGIRQSTDTASVKLQYRLGSHWSVFAGATASTSVSRLPPSPPVRNLGAPAGLSFNSRHFGAQGQYQFSRTTRQDSGSHQFRASINSGVGPLSISAFAGQQNQVPTLSFVLSQTPGLQQALNLLGVQATSIQQVEDLLRDNAALFAAGYIKGASLNFAPLRSQAGGSLNLAGHGHWPQISYNFLYTDDHGLSTSNMTVIHSLAYIQKLGSHEISLSFSLFGMKTPGQPFLDKPSLALAWRHEFHNVPSFLIPERHGTISGVVFRDDNSNGTYQPGMPTMAGVLVVLDDNRRMETGADGVFRFSRVSIGKHKLVASYRSSKPTFFSTQSEMEVEESASVNFGIGFSLSGLMGRVTNDAGGGVGGVGIRIRSGDRHWSATTESDGSFMLRQVADGEYQVEVDEDSVPAGYLTSELAPQTVPVGASSPGKADFTIRALRSIAGRVLRFELAGARSVPVRGKVVTLKETAKTITTDELGRYVFRDLPAGSYTLAVQSGEKEITRSVKLSAAPSALTNIDFQIGEGAAPPAVDKPAPPATAAASQPASEPASAAPGKGIAPEHREQAPIATAPLIAGHAPAVVANLATGSPDASAAEAERAGRQKLSAGQYQAAISLLSEAIRLAPTSATAYNARGFVHYMLHELAPALADLDKAIELSPNYANAYHNRGVTRKAAGDLSGAEADFRQEKLIGERPAVPAPPSRKPQPPIGNAAGPQPAAARRHMQEARRPIESRQSPADQPNEAVGLASAVEERLLGERPPVPAQPSPKPQPPIGSSSGPQLGAARKRTQEARRLIESRQYRGAIDELNEAIRLAPAYAVAYNERAFAFFKLSENARAIQDLNEAIRLDPQYANAYHIRGVVRSAMGDQEGAQSDLKRERKIRDQQ